MKYRQYLNSKSNYMEFLSAIKTLVENTRKYKQKNYVTTKEALKYIEYLTFSGQKMIDKHRITTAKNSVNLMTAHQSKGQEFEAVFVIRSNKKAWFGKKKSAIISPPKLININSGEDQDDQLRLFYVAVTRAKKHLFFTNAKYNSEGMEIPIAEPIQNIFNDFK